MPYPSSAALREIAGPCSTTQTQQLQPLIDAIRQRHRGILGIVYYGSCLRQGTPDQGLVDFYVLVDSYRQAHDNPISALANRLVPPNVYYLETGGAAGTWLRCKYAILSLKALQHGVTHDFLSSLWGRFAQPMALVYTRDQSSREAIQACCGQAVITLLNKALPVLTPPMSAAATLGAALTLSYGNELRTESQQRGQQLATADQAEYARRLQAALRYLDFPVIYNKSQQLEWQPSPKQMHRARHAWRLRRPAGHALSLVRLAKACFTFDNAIDYGAWKLQRHTGVTIEVTPKLRQHPLIHVWPILWRLYRQGVLR